MSFSADRVELARGARTAIIVPDHLRGTSPNNLRDRTARLDEATGLARAIGVDIVEASIVPVRRVNPAHFLGKGQIDAMAKRFADNHIDLVIIDGALTAVQQRNIETALAAKVIDRTALILEIFGERAATAEGRLQVELAHLDYQQGRLVRSWTHLERQRGGFGFLGGPGETQIEADRRMIRDRMASIRRSLDDVRRTRSLHRQRRERAPWPVVAIVGYTNAGKSTLFNRLANSDVRAEDMLFATLDPTMRAITVDGLGKVILSDTVGFLSDLPTQLIAAFRATLEEVSAADMLLHVRDVSHPDSVAQRSDVHAVLAELGIDPDAPDGGTEGPVITEVLNKIDHLDSVTREHLAARAAIDGSILVSALTGEGIDGLRQHISTLLGGQKIQRSLTLKPEQGGLRNWLYEHGQIVADTARPNGGHRITVRLSPLHDRRLSARLAKMQKGGQPQS